MRIISWFAIVCFLLEITYSVYVVPGYGRTACPRYRAYHSVPQKMADARPTLFLPQRYTQRKTGQFSRPMTGHTPQKLPFIQRNLLHHRSATHSFPIHARLYYHPIPHLSSTFIQKIILFSCKTENLLYVYTCPCCGHIPP